MEKYEERTMCAERVGIADYKKWDEIPYQISKKNESSFSYLQSNYSNFYESNTLFTIL